MIFIVQPATTLRKRRVRDRARHAAQTFEQRQLILQRRRHLRDEESVDEREARLQLASACQSERLAFESAEERGKATAAGLPRKCPTFV